ncbi:GNAT family N-acetyltransferase [Pseudoalteromonas tunicata]|uniref:GNAT family N-acetyltransferase n=1 Tax=Pseudoalteromonas tunicata TaxID=314281 RepID=UPI00273DE413|nr:GNAT family N-acetyltransferase [Pseudoalteromonas tunicata]MDP5212222.1 GNAT family N-acetyltransferase [Pseudoalteromonas tunicata]
MFQFEFIDDLTQIKAHTWDALLHGDPFVSHAFLLACQQSQAANNASGWYARHLLIYHHSQLAAVLPGYLKTHSYGEYVFDWSFAEAYEQHNLAYYPKWICAVPFSPICGNRIGCVELNNELIDYINQVLTTTCQQQGWSGWHINFLPQPHSDQLAQIPVMQRIGVQFQWFNQSYHNFDAFLARFTARRRKTVKKERQKALADNISIEWLEGEQISSELMAQFTLFYQQTYLKRSGHLGYFNQDFFAQLHRTMANHLVIMLAKKDHEIIAATLSLKNQHTLYGRYWGAKDNYDFLHFELCYYQGIEYCIEHKLMCFHAGAQGEHKIMRGFEAVVTYSNHYISHPDFSRAIGSFFQQERQQILHYQQQCLSLLPFKNES